MMIVTSQIRFLIFLGASLATSTAADIPTQSEITIDIPTQSEIKATAQNTIKNDIRLRIIQNAASEECCGCKNVLGGGRSKYGNKISTHAHFLCQQCLAEEICKMTSFFDHKCTGCAQLLGYSRMVALITQSALAENSKQDGLILHLLSKMLKESTIDAFLFSLNLDKDRLRLFAKYTQETLLNSTGMQKIGRLLLKSDLEGLKSSLQILVERIGLQIAGWKKNRKMTLEEVRELEDRAAQRLFFYQKARELCENANIQRKLSTLLEMSRFIRKNSTNSLAKEFLFAVIVPIIDRLDRMDSPDLSETLYKIIHDSITSDTDFSSPTFSYLLESIISKGSGEDEMVELRLARAVFTADSCSFDFCTNYVNSEDFTHKFNKLTTWILRVMGEKVERVVEGEYLSYTNYDSDSDNEIGNLGDSKDKTDDNKTNDNKTNDNKTNDNKTNDDRTNDDDSKDKTGKKLETNEGERIPTAVPKKAKSKSRKHKRNDCSVLSDSEDRFVDCSEIGFDEQFEDCVEEFPSVVHSIKSLTDEASLIDKDSVNITDYEASPIAKNFVNIVTGIYRKMMHEKPTLMNTANFYEIARKTAVLADLKETIMADINKQLEPLKLAEAVKLIHLKNLINKEFIYDCILSQNLETKKPQERYHQFASMISTSNGNDADFLLLLKLWDFEFFCPENHSEAVMSMLKKKPGDKIVTAMPKSKRNKSKTEDDENKGEAKDSGNVKERKNTHCFNYVKFYGHYILRNYKKLEKLIEAYRLKYNNDVDNFAVNDEHESNTRKNKMAGNKKNANEDGDRQILKNEIIAFRGKLRRYMKTYKQCFKDLESLIFPFWESVSDEEFLENSYGIYGLNLEVESILRREALLDESKSLLPKPSKPIEVTLCSLFSSRKNTLIPCINEINKRILKRILSEFIQAMHKEIKEYWAEEKAESLRMDGEENELACLKAQTVKGKGLTSAEDRQIRDRIEALARSIEKYEAGKGAVKSIKNGLTRRYYSIMYITSNHLLKNNIPMKEIYSYYEDGAKADAKKIILFCHFKQRCFSRADAKGREHKIINPKFNKNMLDDYDTMDQKEFIKYRNGIDADIVSVVKEILAKLTARMWGEFLDRRIPTEMKLHEIKKLYWELIDRVTLVNFNVVLNCSGFDLKNNVDRILEELPAVYAILAGSDSQMGKPIDYRDRRKITPKRYFSILQSLLTAEDLVNDNFLSSSPADFQ